jgi:YesN/AraC family two-component response regulator
MIMPVMNGRELATRVQSLRPEVKTLFLSGYTADIISDQGVIREDTHFLQKPFSFEMLMSKVREVLDDQ